MIVTPSLPEEATSAEVAFLCLLGFLDPLGDFSQVVNNGMTSWVLIRVACAEAEQRLQPRELCSIAFGAVVADKPNLISLSLQCINYFGVAAGIFLWSCMCVKPLMKKLCQVSRCSVSVEKFLSFNASR